MIIRPLLDTAALKEFERTFDTQREDIATQTRGVFLRAFPLTKISTIQLDDFVIGHQSPTFCAYVEVKTRSWANMQGASAIKFGIYFGKTKSNTKKQYHFAKRFGATKKEAFQSVKVALLSLIRLGNSNELNFSEIDANPLSQMFKAKILSLYFPDKFINICSAEHLEKLGTELGYPSGLLISEYQHLILEAKSSNSITRTWSNPKFMSFLYATYVPGDRVKTLTVKKPRGKAHKKVNFEDIQEMRGRIGKAAEKFALEWEILRLKGADLGNLAISIEDRRDRPSYGYDFLSFTSQQQRRFIEVKSVKKISGDNNYRFYLSENEHSVSQDAEHDSEYYFYLVLFGKGGKPIDLLPFRANEFYQQCEMTPASYVLRFKYER